VDEMDIMDRMDEMDKGVLSPRLGFKDIF